MSFENACAKLSSYALFAFEMFAMNTANIRVVITLRNTMATASFLFFFSLKSDKRSMHMSSPLTSSFVQEALSDPTEFLLVVLAVGRHTVVSHKAAVTEIQHYCTPQGCFLMVSYHNDPLTVFVYLPENIHHITRKCGFQLTSRLIFKKFLRVVDNCPHDAHTLLLAA